MERVGKYKRGRLGAIRWREWSNSMGLCVWIYPVPMVPLCCPCGSYGCTMVPISYIVIIEREREWSSMGPLVCVDLVCMVPLLFQYNSSHV